MSLGGYYAPRVLAFEERVKAGVGLSGPYRFSDIWDEAPPQTRETFVAKSFARDEDDGRAKAAELDLDGVAERIRQPYLAITGRLDRLIPWEQTERAAREAPNGDLPPARGRQPRLRERPLQDAAAGGGLAARAARMSGIAIVGTGMWAPRLAAAAERAGLELVDLLQQGRRPARRVRRALRLRAGRELRGRRSSIREVEGVVLATPNDVHEEQALACAERGRHVFVEKPIADTVEAGERMRRACADAGVTLMVGHAFRRLGAARRVKELLDEGALGRVVLAEANMSLPGSFKPGAWRAERGRNPGGPIMQLGIHHVDTLAYWLGPVRRASGRFAHVHSQADIDDVGVVTLEFESGALGIAHGQLRVAEDALVAPARQRRRARLPRRLLRLAGRPERSTA